MFRTATAQVEVWESATFSHSEQMRLCGLVSGGRQVSFDLIRRWLPASLVKMEHRPENSQNGAQLLLCSIRAPVVVAAGILHLYK